MIQKLLLFSIFFCAHNFYACEESKSAEKLEIVDFTPDQFLAPTEQSAPFVSPSRLEALLAYRGIPITCLDLGPDGIKIITVYNVVKPNSSLYKNRAQAVQAFVATNPKDSLKFHFYLMTRCDGMQKRFGTDFMTGKVESEKSFCVIHRCYNKDCLRLYGYEASLLQPEGGLGSAARPVDDLITRRGIFERLQQEVPSNKKNAVKILHQRSLGDRLR